MVEPWSFLTTLFPSPPTLYLRSINRLCRSFGQVSSTNQSNEEWIKAHAGYPLWTKSPLKSCTENRHTPEQSHRDTTSSALGRHHRHKTWFSTNPIRFPSNAITLFFWTPFYLSMHLCTLRFNSE